MKKIVAVLVVLLSVSGFSACSRFNAPQRQISADAPATQTQQLSRDQAIALALQTANLDKHAVFDLEAELDREWGGLIWEVDFETREAEYSYDIHAYDGTVINAERDRND